MKQKFNYLFIFIIGFVLLLPSSADALTYHLTQKDFDLDTLDDIINGITYNPKYNCYYFDDAEYIFDEDITMDGKYFVFEKADVVFDLNNNTIAINTTSDDLKFFITAYNTKLVIKNGNITSNSDMKYLFISSEASDILLQNDTFNGRIATYGNDVEEKLNIVSSTIDLISLYNADVNISDSIIDATNYNREGIIIAGMADVTINNSTVLSNDVAIKTDLSLPDMNKVFIMINGGTYSGNSNYGLAISPYADLTINAGSFSGEKGTIIISDDSKEKLNELLKASIEDEKIYDLIDGDNQTFTLESDSTLSITINADYDYFMYDNKLYGKVFVDGNELDSKYFTSKSGSTIITLTNEYLNTLNEGKHNLKVMFYDCGYAEAKFTVNKLGNNIETEEIVNPKTGDIINIYTSLLGLSIIGLLAIVILNKSNNIINE